MKKLLPILLFAVPGWSASAVSLNVKVELPEMQVAEYHAPYVAMWLQGQSRKDITNLALWYDHDMKDDEGKQWLKDIRQWWRRSGRSLSLPADGLTGATRSAGQHRIEFSETGFSLSDLAAGDYKFFIEAVREVGGREIISIPFTLPLDKTQTLSAEGKNELGQVELQFTP